MELALNRTMPERVDVQPDSLSGIRVCAITCDSYPDDVLVRRVAEAAAQGGCEYHVICSMEDGQELYEVVRGVYVHRLKIRGKEGKPLGRITGKPFTRMASLWSFFSLLSFVKVARLHMEIKFDIVHVHNLPDFLVLSAALPKFFGAKVILHVQDVAPELMAVKSTGIFRKFVVPLAILQERLSTAFSDHVLTVGWPFEKCLLRRGVPSQKLSSILNSADPSVFPESKRTAPFAGEATAQRPLVVMYHGTCAARNGLDVAIRAVAKALASAPHLMLHIRGNLEAGSDLKQLVRALNIADRVVFLPRGPLETLADFVAQGDIGIIPYPSDGFMELVLPTKAYELALMRRPIIASDTVAIRSMFSPASVMLCEASNVDAFAQAILELYWHPQKRAELAESAEREYLRFRWELMADQYRHLIASLAKTRSAATKQPTGYR
jgi:glycosyltransferase involved in cell wall biosynthesis